MSLETNAPIQNLQHKKTKIALRGCSPGYNPPNIQKKVWILILFTSISAGTLRIGDGIAMKRPL
jgi:hypothetical protein